MNFSEILDQIARPKRPEQDMGYAKPGSAFWSVLERLETAFPVAGADVRQAYFPDLGIGASRIADQPSERALDTTEAGDLSLDPDDILFELDLEDATSVDALSVVRRRFARLNHPDRVRPELRQRANERMTIANALIDAAAERLSA